MERANQLPAEASAPVAPPSYIHPWLWHNLEPLNYLSYKFEQECLDFGIDS